MNDPVERLAEALHHATPPGRRVAQREQLLSALAASPGRHRFAGLAALPGSSWAFKRMRSAGLAGTLLLLPSTAMAQTAAPGDLLYPLKQATETVQQIFDEDAPARHRLAEVEALLERDAPTEVIAEAVGHATDAVEAAGNDDLDAHLAEVRDKVEQQRPDAVPDHAGAPGRPAHPDAPGQDHRPDEPGSQRSDAPGQQDDRPGKRPADDEATPDGATEPDDETPGNDPSDDAPPGSPEEAGREGSHPGPDQGAGSPPSDAGKPDDAGQAGDDPGHDAEEPDERSGDRGQGDDHDLGGITVFA